jgi:Uma2 family endonuclease
MTWETLRVRDQVLWSWLNSGLEGANLNATMKQADIKFTYSDYLQLPDDKRYELVEGEFFLVPAPNLCHQRILRELEAVLYSYLQHNLLGEVFFAPCDVVLSEINVVQPDLIFVSTERMTILTEANIQGSPDLVVEILSPSTQQRDRGIKQNLYARYGVREYWVVDPLNKTVEILSWTETGYHTEAVLQEDGMLNSSLFPDLNIKLEDIFPGSVPN